MESLGERDNSSVTEQDDNRNDDAKDRGGKTPGTQRSVAFDLSVMEDKQDTTPVRRVTISDVTINNIDCDNTEDNLNEKGLSVKSNHKDSVSIKKEIIGILKPPNLKKDLKSFPSLPECFLHDLGLLDNFALSAENLSDQDIENKFSSLSLAFKTDRITLSERLELQHRQRDIAERNAEDEIRQLKSSVQCLNRLCHQSDTREILRSLEKQVGVLQQSLSRVSSSSEQFGAVQQEGRVATAVEIVLLHVDNLKRSYEKEHHELEEARRILIEHKLLVSDEDSQYVRPSNARIRSISVVQPSTYHEINKPRRASLNCGVGGGPKHLDVTNIGDSGVSRSRSPGAVRRVSQNSSLRTVKEDSDVNVKERKSGVFRPIAEMSEDCRVSEGAKNDDNNNNEAENMNKKSVNGAGSAVEAGSMLSASSAAVRRKESRKTSHFDIDTIMEEIDDLAVKRDSSPSASNKHPTSKPLPKTPTEFIQRKKSLLVHIQGWVGELTWPYDEEETILCVRYSIAAALTTAALAILLNTFLQ